MQQSLVDLLESKTTQGSSRGDWSDALVPKADDEKDPDPDANHISEHGISQVEFI